MRILTLLAVLLLSTTALADTFTADFEDGTNLGNWTLRRRWVDTLYPTGGNPGGWYGVTGYRYLRPHSLVRIGCGRIYRRLRRHGRDPDQRRLPDRRLRE